jgi:hypothetical protein
MKSQIKSFLAFFFLLFVGTIKNPLIAQIEKKNWPSCIDYKLTGRVKSWTMKNKNGIVRNQEFNKNGVLIKDSYKGTVQDYLPPEYLPEKLKNDFEKIYKDEPRFIDSTSKIVFNKRMQLIEKQTPNNYEINKFSKEGKIQFHKTIQIVTQTRHWNDTHHAEPTYTFTDTIPFVVIYKYNKAGLLNEFEYYHSDPFKNIRMVYFYDSANNLIESNRYDWTNIPSDLIADNYLNKFANTAIDSGFSINNFYSNYWNQDSPAKMTWKYNNKGQKIEYVAYGYHKGPSFKATWEYNGKGQLVKEIHHDVYHDTISCIVEFDTKGNVIKETDFDYWAKKKYFFDYKIVYY